MNGKKSCKVGFKARKNRLLCWLIVLLSILLAVTIGMFVFLSLNAKYHFACVMGCEQSEAPAVQGQLWASVASPVAATTTQASFKTSGPEIRKSKTPTQKQAASTEKTTTVIKIDRDTIIRSRTPIIRSSTTPTSASTNSASTSNSVNTAETKSRSHGRFTTARRVTTPANTLNLRPTAKPRSQNKYINISGKITFQGKAPKRLPRNSRLIVEFEDVSRMDAASIVLAKTAVDLSKYRRGKNLFYTIICKRPELAHSFYSISAVLNVGWTGWKPRKKHDDWIRNGDFFNDMFLRVHIKNGKTVYERNIQLIKY